MGKGMKRRIGRFWCNRLVMGIGCFVLLFISGRLTRAVLLHQPQQPAWGLELRKTLGPFVVNASCDNEQRQQAPELSSVSEAQQLFRLQDMSLPQDSAPIWVMALAREQIHEQALTMVLAREQALATVLVSLLLLVIMIGALVLTHWAPASSLPRRVPVSAQRNLQKITILLFPEECVAELFVVKRRMKKAKCSTWEIRWELFQQVLGLFWAYYIQIKLENLWLPPGDQRIDE